MLTDPPVLQDISAVVLVLGNNIDNTRNGVGAVNSATTIVQNLNPINGKLTGSN
jgi:hypothetical protein